MTNKQYQLTLSAITCAVFIWSLIKPHDYFTWFLEVAPVLIGLIFLITTYKKFKFTNLSYTLIAIHAIILIIGGHYTYAEVPLFNWFRDIGIFTRNNYDKIGHFAQGFIPIIIAREILIRTSPLKFGKWLAFVSFSIIGLVTAIYEILEWLISELSGSAGDSFLGTQGYIWDTQSDMALCLIGGITALLLLTRWHDKQIKKI